MSRLKNRLALVVFVALIPFLPGCFKSFLSVNWDGIVRESHPRAAAPLAREVRYLWMEDWGTTDVAAYYDPFTFAALDNGTLELPHQTVLLSAVYEQRRLAHLAAAEQTADPEQAADHLAAAQRAAEGRERVLAMEAAEAGEMDHSRIDVDSAALAVAGSGRFGLATVAFMAAATEKDRADRENTVTWVVEQTGAVGDEAPPGSTLWILVYRWAEDGVIYQEATALLQLGDGTVAGSSRKIRAIVGGSGKACPEGYMESQGRSGTIVPGSDKLPVPGVLIFRAVGELCELYPQ